MGSLSKLLTGPIILVLGLLLVQSLYANPVSPGEELAGPIGLLIGLALVVGAVVFSVRAINKIKKRRDKENNS
jgi:hypothetical protein